MFVNNFSLGAELDALTSKVNANVSALTQIQGSISTKTIYAATLLVDSWTPSDEYYTQTVTVTGLTTDSTPIVDITAGELSNGDFVKVQTA